MLMDIVPNGKRVRLINELALAGLTNMDFAHLFDRAKINGNMFVFHFKHNGVKSMFEVQKEHIKSNMRIFYKEHLNELKEERIVFNDICGQFDIKPPKQEVEETDTTLMYKERSTGNFYVPEGTAFTDTFKRIREIIKERSSGTI